jgi:DNA-binding NtrC family response regulator/sugar lactone lactonase YvrE
MGGLVRFDTKRGTYHTFRHNPRDPRSLSSNIVSYVYEDRRGALWVGTYGGGLNRFVPAAGATAETEGKGVSGTFLRYMHNPSDSSTLAHNDVSTILEDSKGALWVGTLGGGLNMIAPDQRKNSSPVFTHFHTENPLQIVNDRINVICEDTSGTLWVGTDGAGLQRFDRRSERFTSYYDAASGFDAILNIHEDAAGRFWVGTYNGGLHLFDRNTGKRRVFTEKDGLLHSSIKGILEDDAGNLWIGTEKGLSKFTYATKTFRNYDVSDGLQKGHFNFNAACKGRDGRMYFGGINGVNVFHPDQLRRNDHPPQIVLTDLIVFSGSVSSRSPAVLDAPVNTAREAHLSHSENDISIQFAALAFSRPGKNIYAYRLEGYDSDWRSNGSQRVATYTNLDPGEYTFRVKAANSDGVWSSAEATLTINIAPPFWRLWWFRGAVLLAVLFSGYALIKRRMSAMEEKRHLLELQVEEKTRAARKIQDALAEVERLKNQLQAENVYLKDEIKLQHNFSQIITRSKSLISLLQSIEKVAQTDSTVLIYGETGTGKELIARAVHEISKRKDRPLIKVDCAALPPSLIESELFGHERGAFTGAVARRIGRFELANGGTIFLDEIGELPYELQPKLLRVIQEGEFNRIGEAHTIEVNVRIIAATNRELQREVMAGKFREDLFYRLNVFPLRIPPLRERKEDIPLLVEHFVQKFAVKMGKPIKKVPLSVIQALERYDWPGNIRELENIIERAVILSRGDTLELFESFQRGRSTTAGRERDGIVSLEEVERQHIVAVLNTTHWRVSGEHGAAKILGMKPTTLASKMEKLGIRRPR